MSYSLVIQPGAEEDINDAYNWYEGQQPGLGILFMNELAAQYEKLERNPLLFSWTNSLYRQAILPRFPYVIVYEVTDTEVHVYSIFHTSRNPKQKFKKR